MEKTIKQVNNNKCSNFSRSFSVGEINVGYYVYKLLVEIPLPPDLFFDRPCL